MSKQIYIDSNGNEVQVSGTVNTADMMPMSGNDSTKVSEAIGDLSQLTTSVTSSLVGAVNAVNSKFSGYVMIEYSDTMPTTQTSKLITIASGVDFGYIVSAMVYRLSDARWEMVPNGTSFDGTAHFTSFKRDNGDFVFRPYIDSAAGVTTFGGATVKVIALVKYSY